MVNSNRLDGGLLLSCNLTYFNRLIIATILGVFLGMLFSWIINTVYKLKTKRQEFTPRILQKGILVILLIGVVLGCIVWGFSLFSLTWDITPIEVDRIKYSFAMQFLVVLFSGSIDTLSGLTKLALKEFFTADGDRSNKTN